MSTPAVTVGPDASCKEIVQAFMSHDISGLPVVDTGGRLLGLVSETDLVAEAAAGIERHERAEKADAGATSDGVSPTSNHNRRALRVWKNAAELMIRDPPSVTLDEGIDTAAYRMLHARCDHLPVVRDGIVVGIVARKDIIRAFDED